jgi:hypothetical protein
MTYRYSITSKSNMSVRPAPATSNSPIGQLTAGVVGSGDELVVETSGNKWLKILVGGVKPDGTVVQGYVAVVYNGIIYCTLIDNGVVIPPTPGPSVAQSLKVVDIINGIEQPPVYYDLRK